MLSGGNLVMPCPVNLLMIRHAESLGNATGNYSSAESDSLSPKGEAQAQSIVGTLASRPYDRIIVSPLLRAMQTIAPYLEATGQRAEIWPEVAEACWHDDREDVAKRWRTAAARVHNGFEHLFAYRNDELVRPAHPESFGEGLRRAHATHALIQSLIDEGHNGTVLMVTHGHFIRELINLILEIPVVVALPHDNCGLTSLCFDGVWSMAYCNRPSIPAD